MRERPRPAARNELDPRRETNSIGLTERTRRPSYPTGTRSRGSPPAHVVRTPGLTIHGTTSTRFTIIKEGRIDQNGRIELFTNSVGRHGTRRVAGAKRAGPGTAPDAFGARAFAFGAEDAAAEVERDVAAVDADGVRRTGVGAGAATVGTARRIDLRRAAEMRGHRRRRRVGIAHRAVPLPRTCEQSFKGHGRSRRG